MTTKRNRPRTVTIMLLGVILLVTWNVAQTLAMARQFSLLVALNIKPDPQLLLIMAAVWAVLFGVSGIFLLRRRSLVRWLIPLLFLLFGLYNLLLQRWFVRLPMTGQDWLLRILLYSVGVLVAFWFLNSSAAKSYFAATQPDSVVEKKE